MILFKIRSQTSKSSTCNSKCRPKELWNLNRISSRWLRIRISLKKRKRIWLMIHWKIHNHTKAHLHPTMTVLLIDLACNICKMTSRFSIMSSSNWVFPVLLGKERKLIQVHRHLMTQVVAKQAIWATGTIFASRTRWKENSWFLIKLLTAPLLRKI